MSREFTSYGQEIRNRIDRVYQTGIALKILEHMDRVRNNSSLELSRRWPMELLQNAGDACAKGQKVRVKIVRDKDTVSFYHNGAPFLPDRWNRWREICPAIHEAVVL